MLRHFRVLLAALALLTAPLSVALAADSTVPALTAGSAPVDADLLYCVQSAGTLDRKCTALQVANYVFGKVSGDLTCAAGGSCTVTKTGGAAFSALATTVPGTGVAAALAVNTNTTGAFVLFNGPAGTPTSQVLTNSTGLPIAGITGLGTGVGTALATTMSAAGGMTMTVASGATALGVGAIGSAACATAVTATATGTATTDVVTASFNGDPTAVTGYVPLTTGMLTILTYPTLNNVNFKVCNNTNASITPGAITLNWRVVR